MRPIIAHGMDPRMASLVGVSPSWDRAQSPDLVDMVMIFWTEMAMLWRAGMRVDLSMAFSFHLWFVVLWFTLDIISKS